jgi:hypothetical protein
VSLICYTDLTNEFVGYEGAPVPFGNSGRLFIDLLREFETCSFPGQSLSCPLPLKNIRCFTVLPSRLNLIQNLVNQETLRLSGVGTLGRDNKQVWVLPPFSNPAW